MPVTQMLEGGARSRRVPPSRCERGSVTAEFAMAMPVLIAVALGMVWLISLGLTQLRIEEAARETARAAARGDADPEALARRIAPAGASVSVSQDGLTVTVTIGTSVPGPGGLFSFVPSPRVEATSVAARE